MRFLYGINTQGQGHINRARYIIDELKSQGHIVDVVFSGPKPPDYIHQLFENIKAINPGFEFSFNKKSNSVNPITTTYRNLPNIIKLLSFVTKASKKLRTNFYNCVISDFELSSSLLGRSFGVPTISLSSHPTMIHPDTELPKLDPVGRFIATTLVRCIVPYYTHSIGVCYTDKIVTKGKKTLHPIFMKSDLEGLKPEVKDHYLVYAQSIDEEDLITLLYERSYENFIVYGYNKDHKTLNVEFKKTDRTTFVEDLRTCKGLISNAGFSLPWEAIILKKFMYLIPMQSQYEQTFNACRIVERNLGKSSPELDRKTFNDFIDWTRYHYYNIDKNVTVKSVTVSEVSSITDLIFKHIKEYES